jgi:hypothetical protein
MTIEARLKRILSDLDKAAGFLEDRGLEAQTSQLDTAADYVEAVKDLRAEFACGDSAGWLLRLHGLEDTRA